MSTYTLKDFGSYTVAGRIHEVSTGQPRVIQFTRSASYEIDPCGHYSIEHAYVQYFVPEPRRPGPPIVLLHGGGMHGSTWETTPDGRPGWLNLLVGHGFEVHVIDNVERGRSGFAVDVWDDEPISRSMEEAWALFRIGQRDNFQQRIPFKGSRFPVEHFQTFAKMMVPRWLSTSHLHVEALLSVLEHTGPAIVFSHSQGGEIATDAMQRSPHSFAALVAIEPSVQLESYDVAFQTPTVLVSGDYLDVEDQWSHRKQSWQHWVEKVNQKSGKAIYLDSQNALQNGHTHFPMLDYGSEHCLAACINALDELINAVQEV